MARTAETLVIRVVPEQCAVAAVRHDVVNGVRGDRDAARGTFLAARVITSAVTFDHRSEPIRVFLPALRVAAAVRAWPPPVIRGLGMRRTRDARRAAARLVHAVHFTLN